MTGLQDTVTELYAAIDARRFTELGTYVATEVAFTAPGGGGQGLPAVGEFLGRFLAAFPDLVHRLDAVVVAGDVVTVELTHVGTHTGPLDTPDGPMAPTGARIDWPGCHVLRFQEGRMIANHIYFDRAELLAQLSRGVSASV